MKEPSRSYTFSPSNQMPPSSALSVIVSGQNGPTSWSTGYPETVIR